MRKRKELLQEMYPWRDKSNIEALKEPKKGNCPNCKLPFTSPYSLALICSCYK